MSGELAFVLVVLAGLALLGAGVAVMHFGGFRPRIRRAVVRRLNALVESLQKAPNEAERHVIEGDAPSVSEEERSIVELERLQEIIEDRKQVARDIDIAHHLWGFYRSHFHVADPAAAEHDGPAGEWYDIRILKAGSQNGLNEFAFELKGARYRFVDDEEQQGWRENLKFFSLFLYDETGRCLIEIPVKMRVDRYGKNYAITSDGPRAFLPGQWVNDFIKVKLKHQSLRNQEIRAQRHQERLWEIEDLKDRYGIED